MGVDIYPPSQPSGMALGYAEVTANQAGITTEVDLTGLTVTVTVPAGRRIKITGHVGYFNDTVNGGFLLNIKEGATVLNRFISYETQASNGVTNHAEAVILPTAGTHTYKLTGTRAVVGTVTVEAAATIPSFILVEDITGTIYPAGTMVTAGIIASEPWISWTPATTGLTVGNGVTVAVYQKFGRTVYFAVKFTLGTTSAVTGNVSFSLPFDMSANMSSVEGHIGTGTLLNSGTGVFPAYVVRGGSDSLINIYASNAAGTFTQLTGLNSTTPFGSAWDTNDTINVKGFYEAVT